MVHEQVPCSVEPHPFGVAGDYTNQDRLEAAVGVSPLDLASLQRNEHVTRRKRYGCLSFPVGQTEADSDEQDRKPRGSAPHEKRLVHMLLLVKGHQACYEMKRREWFPEEKRCCCCKT